MVTVKISEDDLLDMLVARVKHWTDDPFSIELYKEYYERLIDGGCFEGAELDPMVIVDNDYINYTTIITKGEFDDYGIEDEDDDRILVNSNSIVGCDYLFKHVEPQYLISTC